MRFFFVLACVDLVYEKKLQFTPNAKTATHRRPFFFCLLVVKFFFHQYSTFYVVTMTSNWYHTDSIHSINFFSAYFLWIFIKPKENVKLYVINVQSTSRKSLNFFCLNYYLAHKNYQNLIQQLKWNDERINDDNDDNEQEYRQKKKKLFLLIHYRKHKKLITAKYVKNNGIYPPSMKIDMNENK